MCQVGDIILITSYKSNNVTLNRHSFVVLSVDDGKIEGMDYNLACCVMSSFKDEEHKRKKLDNYPGNFPLTFDDSDIINNNGKDGYLKTDQLYLFDRNAISFKVIGNILPDIFDLILEFIEESTFSQNYIVDNLKQRI